MSQIETERPWTARACVVAGLGSLMALLWLTLGHLGMPAGLSAGALSGWLDGQGLWGPILLCLMMIMAVVVGPIPTLPISAASGLAFGLWAGTAIAMTGALAGALLAFWVARFVGRDLVAGRWPGNPLFATDGSQKLLFWTVLLTRLVPLFSFAMISYGAGVTAITAWRFALASVLGMFPMTVVFAGLGMTFELHPGLSLAAAGTLLLIITVLPWYLRRYRPQTLNAWLERYR